MALSYISLQTAVWERTNCDSNKRSTRAQYKLHVIALCEIMENKWKRFAEMNSNICSPQNIIENDIYYTKNSKEVIMLPSDVALAFVDKYLKKAHQTYLDRFTKSMEEVFAKNPDMKRLSDDEIKKIQEDSESENDKSDAGSDEY